MPKAHDLPAGSYTLDLTCEETPTVFTAQNSSGTDYADFQFYEDVVARAPNLYLYPQKPTDVTVRVSFPEGGEIVASEPQYGDPWKVFVEPDGTIEGEYGFLFYEARLPSLLQTEQGFLLDGMLLEEELRSLLGRLGFVGREIEDFVGYWVPELMGAPYYAVFPQDAEKLVTLEIDPVPVRIRRVLLLVRPLPTPVDLVEPPQAEPFVREGFVAAEWGVVVSR